MNAKNVEIPEYAKTKALGKSFTLTSGVEITQPEICYETWGMPGKDADVILIFHALSGDSHCASHNSGDAPGWWEEAVGPGKTIDTDRYHVICANTLGGCRGTSGPNSLNPLTGKSYGQTFPDISIEDMARFQKLFIDKIGIKQICCVIGASMGGMVAMQWGLLFPEITASIAVIASAHRLSTQALAFDIVGRNAIRTDPDFRNGDYKNHSVLPSTGLAIARMIGHITYLSPEMMDAKFEEDRHSPRDIDTAFEKLFSVGTYLGYQGDKFVERFDANSYISLTKAMDHFDLGKDFQDLKKSFGDNPAKWLFVSFSSDWLFPPEESEKCLKAVTHNLGHASYCSYKTPAGHDSFLLPSVIADFSKLMRSFIEQSALHSCSCSQNHLPLRKDLEIIQGIIQEGSSVLDIGCGNSSLLEACCLKRCSPLYGIDNDEKAVATAISKGIPAIRGDISEGIPWFDTASFDYAVLSLTLQSVPDIKDILRELLRVGKKGVVTFPNFAYHKLRNYFYNQGRAPVSQGILKYNWYDSPNIRFFSILDFEDLCREMDISIITSYALDTEEGRLITEEKNSYGDLAIYVLAGK